MRIVMIKRIKNVAFFEFEDNMYNIAFHIPTMTMLKLEKKFQIPVELLIEDKKNIDEICKETGLNEHELKQIKDNLPDDFFRSNYRIFDETMIEKMNCRLVLLASTSCNLRCKYCYAHEGNYNYPPQNMEYEIAKKTIDFFLNEYKRIGSILFFGGEATLNISLLESTTNLFRKYKDEGKIKKTPNYSLITNGLIMNNRIVEFIKTNDVAITVSIDGNKFAHDKLRIDKNGNGTYDLIIENINKLKNEFPEVNIGYECTFTKLHEDLGLTINDINNEIKKKTGIEYGSIIAATNTGNDTEYSPSIKNKNNEYDNIVKQTWEDLSSGKTVHDVDVLSQIINFAHKRVNRYMCAMGVYAFSITPNGDIYPCHMLCDGKKNDFLIGSILDDPNKLRASIASMINKLETYDKLNNEKCKNCFAIGFCGFCPALHILNNDFKVTDQYEKTCDMIRKQAEYFIIQMAKIRTNTEKWNNLLRGIEAAFKDDGRKVC